MPREFLGIRESMGAYRRSLFLVFGTATVFTLWEVIAHRYLMMLPMETWHLISGSVGILLALMVTALATHSVLAQQRRLEEVARLREDLTHMVVHDLRTPLTVMIGSLETMTDGIGGKLPAEAAELTDMALSGSRSLLQLVNNLLDIAKMEAGENLIEIAPANVGAVVEAAMATVRPLASNRHVALDVEGAEPLEPVMLDEEKVERLLVNLLGNAIKFTPSGGAVTLRSAWDGDRGRLTLAVTDTGEGIPPEDLEKIFDKFGQAARRTAGRKMSTGLGLTFCKLVAEAHGGTITVRSEVGAGSTFTIEIPAKVAATSAARLPL